VPVARKNENAAGANRERPSLRQAQRQRTRTRIVTAARELFSERQYMVVSADDIATAAGISRATFYLHFSGKEEVLRTILAEDLGRQETAIRLLANLVQPTRAELAQWVEAFFSGFENRRASTQLFSLMLSLDPSYMLQITQRQDEYIQILSERLAAFRLPEDAAARERHRTRMHMLFSGLNNLAFHLAWPECGLDHAAAVEDATDALAEFMEIAA